MESLKRRFEFNLILLVFLVASSRHEKICPHAKGHFFGFSLENASLHIGTVKVYSQIQCFDQCLRKQGCVYYNFHHISKEGLHICDLFKMEIEVANEKQISESSDSTFSWLEVDAYSGWLTSHCPTSVSEGQKCLRGRRTVTGQCTALVDMIILIDSSNSVAEQNFQKEKDFVKSISKKFDMSTKRARLGVISYGTNATVNIPLGDFNNHTDFANEVNKIVSFKGPTRTSLALDKAYEALFGNGGKARPLVSRAVVLITDGEGNEGLSKIMDRLRRKCTKLFGVSVGTHKTDAEHVADEGNLIKVDEFSVLQDQVDNFTNIVCGVLP